MLLGVRACENHLLHHFGRSRPWSPRRYLPAAAIRRQDPREAARAANSGEPASSGENPAATSAAPPKPVDPNAVDLRSLRQFQNTKFTILTANRLEGTTGDSAAAIFDHYRAALEKLNWKLSAAPAKGQVTEESALGLLNKGDESIVLSIVPYGNSKDNEKAALRQFTVDNLGTCDSGKLPRLPGAEAGYASKISSVYFTDMKVPATAASVKNLLVANGWQPYTKPYTSPPVMLSRVRDQYRKEGNSLRVLVSPKPGKENASAVEYMIGAIGHQLPAPADATDVEFDDAMCLMRSQRSPRHRSGGQVLSRRDDGAGV